MKCGITPGSGFSLLGFMLGVALIDGSVMAGSWPAPT